MNFSILFKSLTIEKTSEIIKSVQNMSNQMTISQLQQVFSGVFSTIANSLIVNNLFKKKITFTKTLLTYNQMDNFLKLY